MSLQINDKISMLILNNIYIQINMMTYQQYTLYDNDISNDICPRR